MNKQVIIAGVLGAAAAQRCDGEIFEQAREAKEQLAAKIGAAEQASERAATKTTDGDAFTAKAETAQAWQAAVNAMVAYESAFDGLVDELAVAQTAKTEADNLAAEYAGVGNKVGLAAEALQAAEQAVVTYQEASSNWDTQAANQAKLTSQVSAARTQLGAAEASRDLLITAANDAVTAWESAEALDDVAKANLTDAWAGDIFSEWTANNSMMNLAAPRTACVATWVGSGGTGTAVTTYADLSWATSGGDACDPAGDPRKSLNTWLGEAESALGVALDGETAASGAYAAVTDTTAAWSGGSGTQATAKTSASALEKNKRLTNMLKAGCALVNGDAITECGADEPATAYTPAGKHYDMGIRWTAAASETSALAGTDTSDAGLNDTAREAVALADAYLLYWPQLVIAIKAEQVRVVAVTGPALATALEDKNDAATAQTEAERYYATAESELAAAEEALARGEGIVAVLQTGLDALNDTVAVKRYMHAQAEQEKADADAAKTLAAAAFDMLQVRKDQAKDTRDDAVPNTAFLLQLKEAAEDAQALVEEEAGELAEKFATAKAMAKQAADTFDAVEAACKTAGYNRAVDNLAARVAKEAKDAETAAAVALAYAEDYELPATGAGMSCAFPPKAADAAQEPRPECGELECCGAAQKFLKDGTKLTVETCQPEGTHTYTYWPPLMEGALVEPTPETWRWQCISGAQKLVAAATATLAASYMMA